MHINQLFMMGLVAAGTACASITSVSGQTLAVGDSTAPTSLDLDGNGTADFEVYGFKQDMGGTSYDFIKVSALAARAWVSQAGNIGMRQIGAASDEFQVDQGFSVTFYKGDSIQVGWVQMDSVGTKLQVGSWAFQPGTEGVIAFGSTTDKVATGPSAIRLPAWKWNPGS